VNTGKEYQTIDGFGGMNHPEWMGSDLTDAQRQWALASQKAARQRGVRRGM
jgi:O-glycosyl hydrolase